VAGKENSYLNHWKWAWSTLRFRRIKYC